MKLVWLTMLKHQTKKQRKFSLKSKPYHRLELHSSAQPCIIYVDLLQLIHLNNLLNNINHIIFSVTFEPTMLKFTILKSPIIIFNDVMKIYTYRGQHSTEIGKNLLNLKFYHQAQPKPASQSPAKLG